MMGSKKGRSNNNNLNSFISAKEIVDKFCISYQALNHYTNLGLLEVIFKEGNIRFYNKNEVKFRLEKIARLAREGYSLRLIRNKLIGMQRSSKANRL